MSVIKIAQIGTGYWGPNITKTLKANKDVLLNTIVDIDIKKIDELKKKWPDINYSTHIEDIKKDVEGVVVSTPAHTHYSIVSYLLNNGFNVFVEKPMTINYKEAQDLVSLAKRKGLLLMVGHVMVYHPAISKIKNIIEHGDLGKIVYISARRENLGKIRDIENALWSLGIHDLAVIDYLIDKPPTHINADGFDFFTNSIKDRVDLILEYDDMYATLTSSWFYPEKLRELTIVGDRASLRFIENLSLLEQFPYSIENKIITKKEKINIPFDNRLPLDIECETFVKAIKNELTPPTSGEKSLKIMKILELSNISIKEKRRIAFE